MFGTLIESRATRQRRTGGSVASLLLHTAIIGGGVVMTARETVSAPPEVRQKPVVYTVTTKEPPKLKTSNPMTEATVAAAPRELVLNVPKIVPTEIPLPDLSAPPTPADFGNRRVAASNMLCDHDCGGPSNSIGADGRDTWTANDLMMRLREDPVPPRYPEALRRAGIEGTVVVKFVVDTTGRIDMKSVEVLRATHDAFVAAVRESLARLRFNPSMVGDRKVSAVAMMPFQFTLK